MFLFVKKQLKKICREFTILITIRLLTFRLEDFMNTHQETLSYFKTLLQYPKASSVKEENLLKCMAINIFSIQLLVDKQEGVNLSYIVLRKEGANDSYHQVEKITQI